MKRRLFNLSFGCVLLLGLFGCGFGEAQVGESKGARVPSSTEAKVAHLQEVMRADPNGEEGAQAALALGNLLTQLRQPQEALVPLRRAVDSERFSHYARLLLARALMEIGAEEAHGEATRVLEPLGSKKAGSAIGEEVAFLKAKLGLLTKNGDGLPYGEQFLAGFPTSRKRFEIQWLMAQAYLNRKQWAEAQTILETIWLDNPESPWADPAKSALDPVLSRSERAVRRLTANDHYRHIKALRAAGLHRHAVSEIDRFLNLHPSHEKGDDAVFLKAMSFYQLKENAACVKTVERLWREYPKSKWLASAGIYAVRAYRRSDSTSEVESWVGRIRQRFPRHERSKAALYELGTYQANVVDVQKGIQTLETLVSIGGRHAHVPDSLWKLAWYHRRTGNKQASMASLMKLLDSFPDSGYRVPALFWLAKHSERDDRERSVDLYRKCRRESPHSYYGHRAEERLTSLGVELGPDQPLGPFPAELDPLDDPNRFQSPSYANAVMLKGLGLYGFAAAELETFVSTQGNRDLGLKLALAELYGLSGRARESDAILLRHFKKFMDAGSKDPKQVPHGFWKIVFPFGYRTEIEQTLRAANIPQERVDPYLIASLILQESRFQLGAISSTGAIGLMQLMEETALEVADSIGLEPISRVDLFDPSLNILLGSHLLSQRIEAFNDNKYAALCSYNAAPQTVRSWWDGKPKDLPLDEFIETLPYLETRIYLKKILANYRNYQWIYGSDGVGNSTKR